MKEWKSLRELFDCLNQQCVYVVLRNFEALFGEDFLAFHPDIDFLCADREAMLRALQCESRGGAGDRVHQKCLVDGRIVPVDIRCVGDGYYCEAWERAILADREKNPDGVFVPDAENYRYSLLYHALIQKRALSDDYRHLLAEAFAGAADYRQTLNAFLRKKGYTYSYPESAATVFRKELADRDLLEKNLYKQARYFLFDRYGKMKKRVSQAVKGGPDHG